LFHSKNAAFSLRIEVSVKYGTTIEHGDDGPDGNVCDVVGLEWK
jgi:hypothetical protein